MIDRRAPRHSRALLAVVSVMVLSLWLAWSPHAVAATRLGLHVTQEELAIWRQRMTDNVTTINGFTYQSIYQNRILDGANIFRTSAHPGADGYWAGQTGTGCLQMDTLEPHGPRFFRGTGIDMLRSAFVFLLTGNTAYADPVKTELLAQVNTTTTPGTDWTNTSKWCEAYPPTGGSYPSSWEITPWIVRLLLAYDYLDAGGYTGFSAADRTAIQTWFVNAANHFHIIQQIHLVNYVGYPGIYSTPQNLTCSGSWCNVNDGPLYWQGPNYMHVTYIGMNGQLIAIPQLEMAVGIKFNHATFLDYAKKAYMAYLKLGIFDNGAIVDYVRWTDTSTYPYSPGSMWNHTAVPLSMTVSALDMLARTGDTSLYDLTGPTQNPAGSGTVVGFRTALNFFAKLANKTVHAYAAKTAGDVTAETLLSWDTENYFTSVAPITCGRYEHFAAMAANLYYLDSDLTTATTRNALCANSEVSSSPRGCADDQNGGCFSGGLSSWPDLPFMYGNMEGVVNPYALTGVTITVDSTYPGYTTAPLHDGVVNATGGTATTWASAESAIADHWVVLAFDTAQAVSSVTLYWAWNSNAGAYMTSQAVLVQQWDGTAYQTVATFTRSTDVASSTVTFSPVTTSRLRFYQSANQGNPVYPTVLWLTEIAYGIQASPPPMPPSNLHVIAAE